jgi:hypothetical protein
VAFRATLARERLPDSVRIVREGSARDRRTGQPARSRVVAELSASSFGHKRAGARPRLRHRDRRDFPAMGAVNRGEAILIQA